MLRPSKRSNDDANGRVRIGEIRVFYRPDEVGVEVCGVEADHLDVALTAVRDATRSATALLMETVRADRARRPQRGDRVEVEGRQGVLVPCDGCRGHGLLHRPDDVPVEHQPGGLIPPAPTEPASAVAEHVTEQPETARPETASVPAAAVKTTVPE